MNYPYFSHNRLNGYGLRGMRGLSATLTPQVSIADTVPQPTPGPTMQRPAIGQLPSYPCPPGMVGYGAYIDTAGNYEFPGCEMAPGGTVSPGGGTPTATGVSSGTGDGIATSGGAGGGIVTPTSILNVNNPPTTNVALLPNSGQMPKGTGNVSNIPAGTVYRFILAMGGGFATGASLPGCSQSNSASCDPKFFNTLQEAINYALGLGEIPYKVFVSQDPWDIMNGIQPINPNQIYNADGSLGSSGGMSTTTLALFAVGAYFLLKKVL